MVWKLQINDNQQLVSLTDYDAQADDNNFQNSLVDFVRRSSCPPNDDYRRLLPWRVRFMTSQDKPDHDHDDVRNNGVDKNSRQFYVQIPFNLCSSLLLDRQTKQNQQQQLLLSEEQLPRIEAPSSLQRVILAIHGYGGRPLQELQKWHESVTLDDTIIIAPQGSPTQTSNGNQKLGWNARDCCGDPVLNDLEDVEFVVHGVVEVFSEALNILISARNHDENSTSRRDNNNVSERNVNIQVIATGFSNGGFFTSLLGLLPSQSRPEWLVGIVPTGGYQYDIGLYNGKHYYEDKIRDVDGSSEGRVPDPLPILMHHGGRDSVVKPEGCCNVVSDLDKNSGIEKSNCDFDIGIHQPTCTSVQSAFEKWVELNHCESGFGSVGGISLTTAPGVNIVDMMIEKKVVHHNGSYDGVDPQNTLVNPSKNHGSHASGHSKNNNESNMEELNSNNQLTCQKGNRCRVPTGFCIWENEGHSWGGKFPGVDMTRVWMDRVFDEAEHHGITAQGNQQLDHVSMETISSNIMGRTMFSEFVLILTFLAAVLVVSSIFCLRGGIKRWSPCKILCYKRAKRKCSEEFVLDGDDVESAQIERGSILEGNK